MLCVVYVVKCSVLFSAQCYLLLSSWTRKTRLPSMLQTSALFFLQWADRFHRADRITWAQVHWSSPTLGWHSSLSFTHSPHYHHSALHTLVTQSLWPLPPASLPPTLRVGSSLPGSTASPWAVSVRVRRDTAMAAAINTATTRDSDSTWEQG